MAYTSPNCTCRTARCEHVLRAELDQYKAEAAKILVAHDAAAERARTIRADQEVLEYKLRQAEKDAEAAMNAFIWKNRLVHTRRSEIARIVREAK